MSNISLKFYENSIQYHKQKYVTAYYNFIKQKNDLKWYPIIISPFVISFILFLIIGSYTSSSLFGVAILFITISFYEEYCIYKAKLSNTLNQLNNTYEDYYEHLNLT